MKDYSLWLNREPLSELSPAWGLNRGFLYGESVFSTLKVEQGSIQFLDDHLNRLIAHLKFLYKFSNVKELAVLKKLIKEDIDEIVIPKENLKLRITLFFKNEEILLKNLNRLLVLTPYEAKRKTLIAKSHTIFPSELDTLKIGNYSSIFYYKRLLTAPFNELCLIDHEGNILECSISNIFFIKGHQCIAPLNENNFLKGITWTHLAKALSSDYKVTEQRININDIDSFDSAFACNSLNPIQPLGKIDNQVFDNSCFEQLEKLWSDYVRKEET